MISILSITVILKNSKKYRTDVDDIAKCNACYLYLSAAL